MQLHSWWEEKLPWPSGPTRAPAANDGPDEGVDPSGLWDAPLDILTKVSYLLGAHNDPRNSNLSPCLRVYCKIV